MSNLLIILSLLLCVIILCLQPSRQQQRQPPQKTEARFLHIAPLHQLKALTPPSSQKEWAVESASAFHQTVQITPFDAISKPPFNSETFFSLYRKYPDTKTPNMATTEITNLSGDQMKKKNDRRNIVPTYIATFKVNGTKLSWKAPCFQNNVGWLTYNDDKKQTFKLTFESSNATSYTCVDWYLFATRETLHIKVSALRGKHTLTIVNLSSGDVESIMKQGLFGFVFPDGLLGTMIDAYIAARTLYGAYFEKDKVKFLAENMPDFPFVDRPFPHTPIVNTSHIGNGDLLGVVTMSGLNIILMYGTGSHIGHVATTLWIPNEQTGEKELFVVEALDTGITRTRYDDWIKLHIKGKQVVILGKLKKEYSQRLDYEKALQFFLKSEGLAYGYQNIAYAWIDTLNDNYPTPLDGSLVPSALTLFGKLSEDWINLLFIDGMNMRLRQVFNINAACRDMACICGVADSLNMTVQELLIIPERDNWLYNEKKERSMVCSVFIMSMFKAGGMFPDLQVEASEFTPKDLYMLDLWDKEWQRPEECLKNGDDFPYCQMLGQWYWPLPDYAGFGVVKPYHMMNEKCGANPPTYQRSPSNC